MRLVKGHQWMLLFDTNELILSHVTMLSLHHSSGKLKPLATKATDRPNFRGKKCTAFMRKTNALFISEIFFQKKQRAAHFKEMT